MERDAPLDAERILETLAQYRVEYVIVGGVAARPTDTGELPSTSTYIRVPSRQTSHGWQTR